MSNVFQTTCHQTQPDQQADLFLIQEDTGGGISQNIASPLKTAYIGHSLAHTWMNFAINLSHWERSDLSFTAAEGYVFQKGLIKRLQEEGTILHFQIAKIHYELMYLSYPIGDVRCGIHMRSIDKVVETPQDYPGKYQLEILSNPMLNWTVCYRESSLTQLWERFKVDTELFYNEPIYYTSQAGNSWSILDIALETPLTLQGVDNPYNPQTLLSKLVVSNACHFYDNFYRLLYVPDTTSGRYRSIYAEFNPS